MDGIPPKKAPKPGTPHPDEPGQGASAPSSGTRAVDPGEGELNDLPPSKTPETSLQERNIELFTPFRQYKALLVEMYDPELSERKAKDFLKKYGAEHKFDYVETFNPEEGMMVVNYREAVTLEEAIKSPEETKRYVEETANENLQLHELVQKIKEQPSQKRAIFFKAIFEGKGADDEARIAEWAAFATEHALTLTTKTGTPTETEKDPEAIKSDISSLGYLIKQYRGEHQEVRTTALTDLLDGIVLEMQQK